MPALVSLVLGVGLGLVSGGRVRNLAGLKLRFELPVLFLFVVQAVTRGRVLGLFRATTWGAAVWVCSTMILAGLLAANWRIPGLVAGSFGALLNTVVVLANRAMPVTIAGVRTVAATRTVADAAGFYVVANGSTVLAWLGDSIPVGQTGTPWLLVSAGDVLLMVAATTLVVWAMVTTVDLERVAPSLAEQRSRAQKRS